MNHFTIFLLSPKKFLFFIISCITWFSASSQVVTIPSSNPNDSSDRKPLGCFYGYERTEALYLKTEIVDTGNITRVAFYVNALNSPATSTPVVIKMKMTSATTVSANTYNSESSGAVTVWSGNITSDSLTAYTWITIILTTTFHYTANNLEVFVATYYGRFGG